MPHQSLEFSNVHQTTAIAPLPSLKKVSLFSVSVREKGRGSHYYDVLVVAKNIREAQRLGVEACESEGLINRHQIKDTLVFEKEAEVYQ